MKPFTYLRPRSVAEATEALAEHAEAHPIAGGQTLLLLMKDRLARPSVLVSLRDVPELRGISYGDDGTLTLGASTTYWELQSAELRPAHAYLREVATEVADVPVQRMGTVAGALCHADPAFDFPLAAVAGDAQLELASAAGARTLGVSEFLVDAYTTALAEGEIVTAIRFPAGPERVRSAFVKHRLRRFDPAIVSVACIVGLDAEGLVESATVAYGAVGPVPARAPEAEQALIGRVVSDEVAREAGQLAAAAAAGGNGTGRFAFDYKRDVLPAIVARALRAASAGGKE